MEITPTIRAEIERYLKQKGLSMTQFGHITNLNVVTVSGIITGNRSLSVNQLDRITLGMNLPPDYFYERFVEECVEETPLNWRRIKPFLYRCVELGRLDCLQRAVSKFLDNPVYTHSLFELAEDLFHKGYRDTAAYLYENVAESESKQHSERLALCQYRLFSIRIGKDQAQNLQTAAKFEPFVDRLDEFDQLDAFKDLANVYRSLSMWDKVYTFSRRMYKLGQIQYDLVHNSKRKIKLDKKLSRPLFVYIAYAELMCAHACDANGDHEQALEHIRGYTDLSWVKETDPDTLHWLGEFQQWAKINTYVNRFMSGDISVLTDYVGHISGKKHIFAELLNVIEVANRYDIDIDHILQRFEPQIEAYRDQVYASTLTEQQVILEETVRFWYKLAKYNLNKGRYSYGFNCLIDAFEKAITLKHALLITNCVGLFERFRAYAEPGILARYNMWERNDRKDGFAICSN
ncbi:helix-turn-helix domain-containing protein [Paenibacillus brasilensis]|uniref:Transcriptional regulator with XRE-family HTH domain n=1 Tax=Paenibacillus brasilensis TaxID=128574 RepID=A0ABU0L0C1_9BACL|nr:helix-turn-helix transcriptional regulator [Paenibacillus brasilensis]MDQ0494066.1 transcriptional regulator with XRE-family HTH domain [Paenibacillus brasilensis]